MATTGFGTGTSDNRQVATISSVDLTNMVYSAFHPMNGTFPVYPSILPGGNFIIPAPGEQWVVVKYDFRWYLEHKLSFQDPRNLIPPKPGMTAVGSTGPTHVVGSEVDLPQSVFLGDWEMRLEPSSGTLQVRRRGTEDWASVTGGGDGGGPVTITTADITDATTTGRNLMKVADAAAGRSTLGAAASANAKGFVNHGTNASMARPIGYASIEWYGSVAPSNATAADTWVDTT